MSFTELIANVERSEKTLVVHNADPETVESVVERFADRNVRVVTASTASGPPDYAVLADGDRVLSTTSLSELVPDGGTPRTPRSPRGRTDPSSTSWTRRRSPPTTPGGCSRPPAR
ncbi:hypothetical protein [Halogeometricum sp. CBA1124]|uniref:hypothetical protein n=1 Tax=Halogeometricum sp. CBA1124 TaxID=2668071 RepID=UPI001E36E5D7|nr:hypothetical protein [Halogeometricum sp. CBA1124]